MTYGPEGYPPADPFRQPQASQDQVRAQPDQAQPFDQGQTYDQAGFAGQQGYGQVQGYGQPQGYGQVQGYGAGQPGGYGMQPGYQQQPAVLPKNPAVSVIASFFVPGLGSMLNGNTSIGIVILITYIVGWVLTLVLIGFFIVLGAWIWGMVDAYSSAQKWNQAHGIIS